MSVVPSNGRNGSVKVHPVEEPDMVDTRMLVQRPDVSATTAGLLIGDVAFITLFVVLGEFQHNPGAIVERTPGSLIPFLVGWMLAALLAGVYSWPVLTDPRTAVVRTGLAWVGAVVVGQGLRAMAVFPGEADPVFVAVSLGVGLVLLLPWRAVAGFLLGS